MLDCCEKPRAVTLIARRQTLLERLQEAIAQYEATKKKSAKRLLHVQRLYQHPARLEEVMQEWIDYCAARGAETVFIDVTDEPRVAAAAEWKQLMLT